MLKRPGKFPFFAHVFLASILAACFIPQWLSDIWIHFQHTQTGIDIHQTKNILSITVPSPEKKEKISELILSDKPSVSLRQETDSVPEFVPSTVTPAVFVADPHEFSLGVISSSTHQLPQSSAMVSSVSVNDINYISSGGGGYSVATSPTSSQPGGGIDDITCPR